MMITHTRRLITNAATLALLTALAGCSHLPDAKVAYYLADTTVKVKVVRTLACDKSGMLIVGNAATPSLAHSADRSKTQAFDLAPFATRFKDADLKFEFFDDGRLKSLNSTSSGQGEAALNTAIKIASVALAGVAFTNKLPDECETIKAATDDKPLSLVYEGDLHPPPHLKSWDSKLEENPRVKPGPKRTATLLVQAISPDIPSEVYAKKLAGKIGEVCATLQQSDSPPVPVQHNAPPKGPSLQARHPGLATLKVYAHGRESCKELGQLIWSGDVAVAQFGTEYLIPVPISGLFGKQVVSLAFAESGALTSVQYATTPGASQTLNVISTGLTEAQGRAAARAAQLKAEADLIAEQQRLVQCRADPAACKAE